MSNVRLKRVAHTKISKTGQEIPTSYNLSVAGIAVCVYTDELLKLQTLLNDEFGLPEPTDKPEEVRTDGNTDD